MSSAAWVRVPLGLALLMIASGLIGSVAAFALTLDRFALLADPDAVLSCNLSVIVQCGANLSSAQGEVFGFPNPLIGLIGYPVIAVVGIGVLAGARYARWFFALLTLAVTAGMAFVVWLIGQSIFVITTLCPWCMVVWAVTIPLFLAVVLHAVRARVIPLPSRVARAGGGAYSWVPFITLLCYIAIAVLAQVRLDVLGTL